MLGRYELEKLIKSRFGEVQWRSAMGWGEGCITAFVMVGGEEVKGVSSGDCTSLEAILELAVNLGLLRVEVVGQEALPLELPIS